MTDKIPPHPLETVDRKRGILTRGDRELLLEQADYDNEQQIRDARYRLRHHLKEALFDAYLVANFWPAKECSAVLESIDKEFEQEERVSSLIITHSLNQMAMKFLWTGLEDGPFENLFNEDLDTERYLEDIVRSSIQHAAQRAEKESQIPEIEVDINITRGEIDESNIIQSLLYGTAHPNELSQYLEHGDIETLKAQLEELNAELVLEDDGEKRRIGPDEPLFNEEGEPISDEDDSKKDE